MPELKLNVQANHLISKIIDDIAHYAIVSLFYFKLESVSERHENRHVGTGHILCILRENDSDFKAFIDQLSNSLAYFCLNNSLISEVVNDHSFLRANENFRKCVQLNIGDSFTISLKQEELKTCNISGSSYFVDRLVAAQGLHAYFDRADHRKRKRCTDNGLLAPKRQCRIQSNMNEMAPRRVKR